MSRLNPQDRDPLSSVQPWQWYAKLQVCSDDPAVRLRCHNIVWFRFLADLPDEPQPALSEGDIPGIKLYRALRKLGFSVYQARVRAYGKCQITARKRHLNQRSFISKHARNAGIIERVRGINVEPAPWPYMVERDEYASQAMAWQRRAI